MRSQSLAFIVAASLSSLAAISPAHADTFLIEAENASPVTNPMLIKDGADLPLLLIFAGVVGGLIAFGVTGLFIGPVVLAVAYTLLVDWVSEGNHRMDESGPRRFPT